MPRRGNPLTEYGLSVKKKLLELNQSSAWLAESVAVRGNCYMDVQYLNKICNGKATSQNKIALINQILDEEEARQKGKK